MPKFRYVGTADLPLDQGVIKPGDIIEASGPPGKNFEPADTPVSEPVAEPPRRKAREATPSLEREEG